VRILPYIVLVASILVSVVWVSAFVFSALIAPPVGSSIFLTRGCVLFGFDEIQHERLEIPNRVEDRSLSGVSARKFVTLWQPGGAVLRFPSYEFTPGDDDGRIGFHIIVIPHWLTNLITWSLFFILWRKSRKHPKGHCQGCGYDLTGNTTGVCPECNANVAAQAEATK